MNSGVSIYRITHNLTTTWLGWLKRPTKSLYKKPHRASRKRGSKAKRKTNNAFQEEMERVKESFKSPNINIFDFSNIISTKKITQINIRQKKYRI